MITSIDGKPIYLTVVSAKGGLMKDGETYQISDIGGELGITLQNGIEVSLTTIIYNGMAVSIKPQK